MTQTPDRPDPLVLTAVLPWLRDAVQVATPSAAVAEALEAEGVPTMVTPVEQWQPGSVTALGLLAGELSTAGEHAEGFVARAVELLAPDGMLAVAVPGAVAPSPDAVGRRYGSEELRRTLGHHGVDLQLLCAPGAAAKVRGEPVPTYEAELDRLPGLLDAAPHLLAVGRTAGSAAARSRAFFGTLPQKVVAAAVLCRDSRGRLLIVHDTFKRHWTIPGGVVDAHEGPGDAAVREAWEEAGVRVAIREVAGVFSASWPDRVVLIYRAEPVGVVEPGHQPVHTHEIDAVAWVPLVEALRRLAPFVAEQVRHCLEHPGGSLRQGCP
ncbi:MAG: NUDIX domain-containing protein [Nitriliruptorales bacterium]|nr:NUDIX domain-containing protein [Nitriliruptorales bacterium]